MSNVMPVVIFRRLFYAPAKPAYGSMMRYGYFKYKYVYILYI